MAQKKAHEVDRWLAKPDPDIRMVLIYGPHRGLVAEQAARFIAATGISPEDPFAIEKFDGTTLSGDAGLLVDALQSIPMFGGKRLVWVRDASAAGKELASALATLATTLPEQSFLLAEAGDLRKNAPLRSAFEASDAAMALPCYADDARALDRILDEALAAASMRMTLAARQAFKDMINGDRLAARMEIDKLLLYCHGQEEIDVADIAASAGDVSALSVDAIADLVLSGRTSEFDRHFARAMSAGMQPNSMIAAVLRQLQLLQNLRYRIDRDRIAPRNAVAAARPPVFFARRDLVATMLALYDATTIARMLGRLQEAVLASRSVGAQSNAAAHRTLLSLSLEAARLMRQGTR